MLIMWALLSGFLVGVIYSYVFILGHKREYVRVMCGQEMPSEQEHDLSASIDDFAAIRMEKPFVKEPETPYIRLTKWVITHTMLRHVLLIIIMSVGVLFTRSLFLYEVFGFALGFWGFVLFDYSFVDQQRTNVISKCIENGAKGSSNRLSKGKRFGIK